MTSKLAFVPTEPKYTTSALSQAFARQVARMNEHHATAAMTEAMRFAKWMEVLVSYTMDFYERKQRRHAAPSTPEAPAVKSRLFHAPASNRGSRRSRHVPLKVVQSATDPAAGKTVVSTRVQLGCTTTLSYHDRDASPRRCSLASLFCDQSGRERPKADGSFEQLATADYDRFHYGRHPEGLSRDVRVLKTHCSWEDEKSRGIWIARRRPFVGGSLATAGRAS